MATAVKKLDVGELFEVEGRRYEIVTDGEGTLTLEPAITPMAELDRAGGAPGRFPRRISTGCSAICRPTARVERHVPIRAYKTLTGSTRRSGKVQCVAEGRRDRIDVRVEIDDEAWAEEVGRLRERSPARDQAEKARREIESSPSTLPWQPCEEEGPEGTELARCVKLKVPISRGRVARTASTSRMRGATWDVKNDAP